MPKSIVSPSEARAELARMELARRRYAHYRRYIAPWYRDMPDGDLVASKLEQVYRYIETGGREGIGRLMVFKPPRHSKTTDVSRLFPSWCLGKNPDMRVILTSYGADLSQEDSRAVRQTVESERYQRLFGEQSVAEEPVVLSDDSRSKASWNLADPHRGGLASAGIGGAITGKGAHLLVIDDPFKNREDAESEPYRRRVRDWYQSVAYTRLETGGAIVVTHTRWHQDDLAGQLLQMMVSDPLADQWDVLFLPALALPIDQYPQTEEEFRDNLAKGLYLPMGGDPLGRSEGQALWPEKFDEENLARKQVNIGEFEFASLYQQLPRPVSGGFFDEQDFKFVDKVPEKLQWYRYVDLALGESKKADWNTTGAVAMDAEGNLYLRDVVSVHSLEHFLPVLRALMLDPNESGVIWGIESNNFQTLVWNEFMKDAELAMVPIRKIIVTDDKQTRARPVQMRAKGGKFFLLRGTWTAGFLRQAVGFPTGQHDDMVDMVSGGLRMISLFSRAKKKAGQHDG